MQFKSLKIRKDLFNDYYNDTCKIKKEDLISFMKANSNYEIKDDLQNTKAKAFIIIGDNERRIIKKSAKIINKKIRNSIIKTKYNYYHGDFSINNPDDYINEIKELISDKG